MDFTDADMPQQTLEWLIANHSVAHSDWSHVSTNCIAHGIAY